MKDLSKYELEDDELDDVVGGIDFSVVTKENLTLFIKALISGDSNVCVELITKFLSEGANPKALERLIDRFVNNQNVKRVLVATLKK